MIWTDIEQAKAEERAAIVAWLRAEAMADIREPDWRCPYPPAGDLPRGVPCGFGPGLMLAISDMIEDGLHSKVTP